MSGQRSQLIASDNIVKVDSLNWEQLELPSYRGASYELLPYELLPMSCCLRADYKLPAHRLLRSSSCPRPAAVLELPACPQTAYV